MVVEIFLTGVVCCSPITITGFHQFYFLGMILGFRAGDEAYT